MRQNLRQTPVLMLVFNRPEITRRVFDVLREVRPKKLFISADGPRATIPDDKKKCAETRKIFENIDWECEVYTHFSDRNLGCLNAVSAGINWFFSRVNEGIILEDDCLPDTSFFPFCEEMLERYRDDTRIMHINGNNFGTREFIKSPYSYHFTSYGQVWGWASWSRAWKLYQRDLELWPIIKEGNWLRGMGWNKKEYDIQIKKYERMTGKNAIDTWDYQWHFTLFVNNGLAISPKINLVSNIGFNEEATHTKGKDSVKSEIPTGAIKLPLCHPEFIMADYRLDEVYRRMMIRWDASNIIGKLYRFIRKKL